MELALFLLLGSVVTLYPLGHLYCRQSDLIFRPGPWLERTPADFDLTYEELRLQSPSGLFVRSWWIPSVSSQQAVIFFHGSDGNITHELPTILFLAGLSLNTLVVEYPGYTHDGIRPSEADCYQASEAAWQYLVEKESFPPERIILFGQSLGSAVATYLAAHRPCGGLVIQSGFTSVPDLAALAYPFLPVRFFVHTKMHSLARIPLCHCPVLIIHSETDEAIPIDHARQLFARAQAPKRFVSFYGPHFGNHWLRVPAVHTAWQQLLAENSAHSRGRKKGWDAIDAT